MEGQKISGKPQKNSKSVGGGFFFFKKWGPKYKRHNGITMRNNCTKFGWATSNGRAKNIGGTSKFLQVHREGRKFFSKNGD